MRDQLLFLGAGWGIADGARFLVQWFPSEEVGALAVAGLILFGLRDECLAASREESGETVATRDWRDCRNSGGGREKARCCGRMLRRGWLRRRIGEARGRGGEDGRREDCGGNAVRLPRVLLALEPNAGGESSRSGKLGSDSTVDGCGRERALALE